MELRLVQILLGKTGENHDLYKSFTSVIPAMSFFVSYIQKIVLVIVSELKQYLEYVQKIIIALESHSCQPVISSCQYA